MVGSWSWHSTIKPAQRVGKTPQTVSFTYPDNAVSFQVPGELPREGSTEHQSIFQCHTAPAALVRSHCGLVRCHQVWWPPHRMANWRASSAPQSTPHRDLHGEHPQGSWGQIPWEVLRGICIGEVLQVAESIQCLVSLLFNEGKDACYFGMFLSRLW